MTSFPRRAIALLFVAMTLTAAVAWPTSASTVATQRYDIPAGSLADSLNRFADESGVKLVYDAALTAGRDSPEVKGDFTPEQALARLLKGAGLVARSTGTRAYTLDAASQDDTGTIRLNKLRVEGELNSGGYQSPTSDPAATEGSGSYAATASTIFKTPLSQQETPVSVSVLTQQRLADQNLFDLKDALVLAPGISLDQQGEDISFYSRGYVLNTQVDGVPMSSSSRGNLSDTAIYDRIEILRGPVGILDGVGSIGGSLNLVRKRPTRDLLIDSQLSYGSWNNFHGDVDVSGPLNTDGSIRGRAVVAFEDRDYFYDVVSRKHLTSYGVVEFDLGSQTVLGLTANYTRSVGTGQYYGIPEALTRLVSRSTYPGVNWTGSHVRTIETGADLTHDFGDDWKATLRFIRRETRYDYTYLVPLGDPESAQDFVPFIAYIPQGKDTNNALDASISGPLHLLGGNHVLTIGGNYDWSDTLSAAPNTIAFGTAISPDIEKPAIDAADDFTDYRLRQWAPYAQGRFDLSHGVALTIGGRLSQYLYRYRYIYPSQTTPFTDYGKQNGRVTPYAGLTWDLLPTVTLYSSYAQIFNPQTYAIAFDGKPLPPVIGWQGESGIKGSFLDKKLNASLSYYRIRETNRAMKDPDPSHVDCGYSGGDCYLATGLVVSRGVDAELSGSPLRGLQIQGSYTYNHNEYLADTYSKAGDIYVSSTPQHQLKLWANYQFGSMRRQDVGRWNIGGGMTAQTKISFGSDDPYGQGAYALFNAQIGYRPTEDLQLTLTVNNIFDRTYLESVFSYNYYGEPRNVMLSLRYAR